MMPLHYVRHKHCAIRPCSDGLRTGAASERPAPTRCASAFVCLSLLKKPNERERERERERRRLHRHSRGQAHESDSAGTSVKAVPRPSTSRALRRLSSEVRRDPVH